MYVFFFKMMKLKETSKAVEDQDAAKIGSLQQMKRDYEEKIN